MKDRLLVMCRVLCGLLWWVWLVVCMVLVMVSILWYCGNSFVLVLVRFRWWVLWCSRCVLIYFFNLVR